MKCVVCNKDFDPSNLDEVFFHETHEPFIASGIKGKQIMVKEQYNCPNSDCGETLNVESSQDEVKCPCCSKTYWIDRDTEFVDGIWRNLTKLIEL